MGLIKDIFKYILDANGSVGMFENGINGTVEELGEILEKNYRVKLSDEKITEFAESLLRITEFVLKHENRKNQSL